MISEIYTKPPWDPTYQENIIDHNDIYESILSKVRMILFTKPGEVIGNPNFGVDLESYVFSLNASTQSIEKMIQEQINQYVPEALVCNISVNVEFVSQDTHDIAFVNIKIDGTEAMSLVIN